MNSSPHTLLTTTQSIESLHVDRNDRSKELCLCAVECVSAPVLSRSPPPPHLPALTSPFLSVVFSHPPLPRRRHLHNRQVSPPLAGSNQLVTGTGDEPASWTQPAHAAGLDAGFSLDLKALRAFAQLSHSHTPHVVRQTNIIIFVPYL